MTKLCVFLGAWYIIDTTFHVALLRGEAVQERLKIFKADSFKSEIQ